MSPSFTILHDLLAVPPAPTDLATPLPDDIATVVVAGLKAEVDRCWATDLDRSLQMAEYITAIGQARGDLSQIALGTMACGDTYNIKGDKRHAAEYLARAADLFLQADDEIGWARTRIGFIALSVDTGEIEQAFADAERARQIFLTHGKDDLRLRLAINTAFTYIHIGKHQHAHDTLLTALALAEQIGPSAEKFLSIVYTNLGFTSERAGEIDAANQYHQHAFRIADQRGDVLNAINARNNQAALDNLTGNYKRALRTATEARDLVRNRMPYLYTHSLYLVGESYARLGRWNDVIAITDEGEELLTRLDDVLHSGLVLHLRGNALAEIGQYRPALEALSRAQECIIHLQESAWLSRIHVLQSEIYLRLGDLESATAIGDRLVAVGVAQGEIWHLQAQLAMAAGDPNKAFEYARNMLDYARQHSLLPLWYEAHHQMAQALLALGRWRRARRHLQAAMATISRSQLGLTVPMRPGFMQGNLGAFRSLMRLELSNADAEAAFSTLERMKAQTWLHYALNHNALTWRTDDRASEELLARLNDLREKHHWAYHQLYSRKPPNQPLTDIEQDGMRNQLRQMEAELRQLTEALYLRTDDANAGQIRPLLDIPAIRSALHPGDIMLAYYDDGDHITGFALTPNAFTATQLPITHDQLTRAITQIRFNISSALQLGPGAPHVLALRATLQQIATKLYTQLAEPLLADLPDHTHARLIVVPYGQLHLLPFHLLHTGQSWLGHEQEITVFPSASLLMRPKLKQPPGALAVAVTEGGLLPKTIKEAQMVYAAFGGRIVTDEQVNRHVFAQPPLQVLHIAAHGEHRLDQPDLSYISLGREQLFTDDLFQLDLRYELVTLSACETGLATVAPGDDLVGLGRGFLFSGAETLLTTLWPVVDSIAHDVMATFYTALSRGLSKSSAYRLSLRTYMESDPHLHPAFWGAFQLIGNPDPLSGLPQPLKRGT